MALALADLSDNEIERLYRRAYYRVIARQPGRDWSTLFYYSPTWYKTLKTIYKEVIRRGIDK